MAAIGVDSRQSGIQDLSLASQRTVIVVDSMGIATQRRDGMVTMNNASREEVNERPRPFIMCSSTPSPLVGVKPEDLLHWTNEEALLTTSPSGSVRMDGCKK